jgi:hypothetical protein
MTQAISRTCTAPDPSLLRFWYRESPQPLETWRFPFQYGNVSRVSPVDPPLALTAMALVRLDPTGLFIFFPVTGNLRAWYAGAGVTALLVLAALALFGFKSALAGRPALGKAAPQE